MDTAVILVGGFGTRLKPLTNNLPKPLLPVAGKPAIQQILDLLVKYNFKKAIITLGYKSDKIIDYFRSFYGGIAIKEFVVSHIPSLKSVYVWLQLSELGHSVE